MKSVWLKKDKTESMYYVFDCWMEKMCWIKKLQERIEAAV